MAFLLPPRRNGVNPNGAKVVQWWPDAIVPEAPKDYGQLSEELWEAARADDLALAMRLCLQVRRGVGKLLGCTFLSERLVQMLSLPARFTLDTLVVRARELRHK